MLMFNSLFFLDCLRFDIAEIVTGTLWPFTTFFCWLFFSLWNTNSLWSFFFIISRGFLMLWTFLFYRYHLHLLIWFLLMNTLLELNTFDAIYNIIAIQRVLLISNSPVSFNGISSSGIQKLLCFIYKRTAFSTVSFANCTALFHLYSLRTLLVIWIRLNIFVLLWNWLIDLWLYWNIFYFLLFGTL